MFCWCFVKYSHLALLTITKQPWIYRTTPLLTTKVKIFIWKDIFNLIQAGFKLIAFYNKYTRAQVHIQIVWELNQQARVSASKHCAATVLQISEVHVMNIKVTTHSLFNRLKIPSWNTYYSVKTMIVLFSSCLISSRLVLPCLVIPCPTVNDTLIYECEDILIFFCSFCH